MRCTSPRTVGFEADGKTLCWSPNKYSKEFAPWPIPCGKCAACLLERARQFAIRAVHEASLYEKNSFITLTYSDEHLKSEKLVKKDIDLFIKKLRDKRFRDLLEKVFPDVPQKKQRKLWNQTSKETRRLLYDTIAISVFGCGEYGTRAQRPHWHLLVFNYRPNDSTYLRTTDLGDRIFKSEELDRLWSFNDSEKKPNEIGDVTFKSSSYCARYTLKKSDIPEFQPIPVRSSANAIGKRWLRDNLHIFNHGEIALPDGTTCGIPRYYEKLYKKWDPEGYSRYVMDVKSKIIEEALKRESKITLQEKRENFKRAALYGLSRKNVITRNQTRKKILEKNIKESKRFLKL